MKFKTIWIILFNLLFINIYGQEKPDTIVTFFNKDWKLVIKDSAEFYRKSYKENSLFKINDYYISSELQMEGNSRTIDGENKEGVFKYFTINGLLDSQGANRYITYKFTLLTLRAIEKHLN